MRGENVPTYIEQLEAEYDQLLGSLEDADNRFRDARAHVEPQFAAVAAEKKSHRRWAPGGPAAIDEYNAASDAVFEVHRKMRDVIARLGRLP